MAAPKERPRDESEPDGVQLGKVQPPVLRPETLERPRLLDWLRAKVNGRVVLLIADAGYGKTTLLADLSRRTRLRTLWYRLDETDRDWTSFLRHLVAAGREHDPGFAPASAALLSDMGVGGPTRETVLETFLHELPSIATEGAIVILDDFHLVDDAIDVRLIAQRLVQDAPERLCVVFASRRQPTIPLSKLRAIGEVAELQTDDLRFDTSETVKLFTETYGRQVEPDVLADLARRTEGWVASLQLVQAALRDRSPSEVRRFVRTLNGADHEMYDYLAEEVVGDLDDDLQTFLMRTSILQVVTPELAQVVVEESQESVARLTQAAERLTLLSRVSGGPRTHLRYHPLVRQFLEARLIAFRGTDAIRDLHLQTAASSSDWRIAAHHYREAGSVGRMLETIASSISTIMSSGQHLLAHDFIQTAGPSSRSAALDLVTSRVDMQRRDYVAATAASRAVLDATSDPVHRDYALLNLLTLSWNQGVRNDALDLARQLAESTTDLNLRRIAEMTSELLRGAEDGDIQELERKLRSLAEQQRGVHVHHFGVSMLNLASLSWSLDRPEQALCDAEEGADALDRTSGFLERGTAVGIQLLALAALGDWSRFAALQSEFEADLSARVDPDSQIELADVTSAFMDPDEFELATRGLDQQRLTPSFQGLLACVAARAAARRHQVDSARTWLSHHSGDWGTVMGARTEYLFTVAYVRAVEGDPDANALADAAREAARQQRALRWQHLAELLRATLDSSAVLERELGAKGRQSPWSLTYLADRLVPRLSDVGSEALAVLELAAQRHPIRWRHELRRAVAEDDGAVAAAHLLEAVGERRDIPLLRKFGRSRRRSKKDATVGRALARRLAPRVEVEDQGRVHVRIGERAVAGSEIRRKVLALLCFLLTRTDLSATRDQVLDALWPDLEPSVAVNSLNQTLYFLRRVFEEEYVEDLSPGYVHHDSEVIWLDPELVTSRSATCRHLIRELKQPAAPEEVARLIGEYRGRFALDFEYEEWAAPHRDGLHAAYLEIVERALQDDIASGHLDRGIANARRALEVDPDADQIEVCLLRLYRAAGAHAAAAEQYGHYAAKVREDLGIEPPSLESLVG